MHTVHTSCVINCLLYQYVYTALALVKTENSTKLMPTINGRILSDMLKVFH